MKNINIKRIVDEIIMDRFIMNFVPGIILFQGLSQLPSIPLGTNLISGIIILSFSWVLGFILEILAFQRIYSHRIKNTKFYKAKKQYLLITKFGLAIVISCIISFINFMIDIIGNNDSLQEEFIIRSLLKTGVIMFIGFFLWIKFIGKLSIKTKTNIPLNYLK